MSYALVILVGDDEDDKHEFQILEHGIAGVASLSLKCEQHGEVGEPITQDDEVKYRVALHAIMDRAYHHAGGVVVWVAPHHPVHS